MKTRLLGFQKPSKGEVFGHLVQKNQDVVLSGLLPLIMHVYACVTISCIVYSYSEKMIVLLAQQGDRF